MTALDDRPAGGPDHSGMADVIADMTDPDEVTDLLADTLAEMFRGLTREGQEARDNVLAYTISAAGRCVREGAYRLAGTPPTDPELMWTGQNRAANMGTIIHQATLPRLATLLGGRAEVPVQLRVGEDLIPGTADLVAGHILLELKSARDSRIVGAIAGGPYYANRVQAILYGAALVQAGEDIRWVAYLYLDRASGDEYLTTEPLTTTTITWALGVVWKTQMWRSRPDRAPRGEHGPGLSKACDECGWLRRCWGATARPYVRGPQRRLGRDIGAIGRLLVEHARKGAEYTGLKKERDFLKEVFTAGSRPGNYGDLRWYRTPDGEELDAAEAERLLIKAGIPVPMKPRAGQVRIGPAKRDH